MIQNIWMNLCCKCVFIGIIFNQYYMTQIKIFKVKVDNKILWKWESGLSFWDGESIYFYIFCSNLKFCSTIRSSHFWQISFKRCIRENSQLFYSFEYNNFNLCTTFLLCFFSQHFYNIFTMCFTNFWNIDFFLRFFFLHFPTFFAKFLILVC